MSGPRILVVGAGIVGTHCALQLRERQPEAVITILDRAPFSYAGASSGNVGGFATCEVSPLATIGNLGRGLAWMFDPLAPLAVRPSTIGQWWPWLAGFVKAAFTPGHAAHVVLAQQALMARAEQAHVAALRGTGIDQLISQQGALMLYRTPRRLEHDWSGRLRLFRERGETVERLDSTELRRRLPELAPEIEHGVHLPAIRHWKSPAELLRRLHALLPGRRIAVRTGDVRGVDVADGRATAALLADGSRLDVDQLVVAAGAWSRAICKVLGDKVPLDTERGYATTLPASGLHLDHLLLFPDDEFVATPMLEGLRLGGTVELAGLHAPPNFDRTRALVRLMGRYFPLFDPAGRDDWMGFRPSMPDGLPVIGRSPRIANVLYGFGHGHVGMTQSAITGRLVAQLSAGEAPEIDLAPYDIARFDRGVAAA